MFGGRACSAGPWLKIVAGLQPTSVYGKPHFQKKTRRSQSARGGLDTQKRLAGPRNWQPNQPSGGPICFLCPLHGCGECHRVWPWGPMGAHMTVSGSMPHKRPYGPVGNHRGPWGAIGTHGPPWAHWHPWAPMGPWALAGAHGSVVGSPSFCGDAFHLCFATWC